MSVCMNMRITSRAYCALPLVSGACSALVHLLWILGAWCPDFSAPLPACSACWVLTLFAHCVAMPGSVASEGIRWQSPLACAATLPFVCAVFASIFSLAIRTWCPLSHLVRHARCSLDIDSYDIVRRHLFAPPSPSCSPGPYTAGIHHKLSWRA